MIFTSKHIILDFKSKVSVLGCEQKDISLSLYVISLVQFCSKFFMRPFQAHLMLYEGKKVIKRITRERDIVVDKDLYAVRFTSFVPLDKSVMFWYFL